MMLCKLCHQVIYEGEKGHHLEPSGVDRTRHMQCPAPPSEHPYWPWLKAQTRTGSPMTDDAVKNLIAKWRERAEDLSEETLGEFAMGIDSRILRQCANDLDALLSASSAPPVTGWQPIETAPKDGTQVWLYVSEHGQEYMGIGRWVEYRDKSKGWGGGQFGSRDGSGWMSIGGSRPSLWQPHLVDWPAPPLEREP